MDTRFEVRDAQEVFEALADRDATGATAGEGLIDPQAIGVMGGSYGGGISMALAALKNRKMLSSPATARLVAWVSDGGRAMRDRRARSPTSPGPTSPTRCCRTATRSTTSPTRPTSQRGRVGVMKQSFVAGLYATGLATSNYAPPGTDPDADLTSWFAPINAGEPYDQNPLSARTSPTR